MRSRFLVPVEKGSSSILEQLKLRQKRKMHRNNLRSNEHIKVREMALYLKAGLDY